MWMESLSLCPGRDSNSHGSCLPWDFKSHVSTSFTTRAGVPQTTSNLTTCTDFRNSLTVGQCVGYRLSLVDGNKSGNKRDRNPSAGGAPPPRTPSSRCVTDCMTKLSRLPIVTRLPWFHSTFTTPSNRHGTLCTRLMAASLDSGLTRECYGSCTTQWEASCEPDQWLWPRPEHTGGPSQYCCCCCISQRVYPGKKLVRQRQRSSSKTNSPTGCS